MSKQSGQSCHGRTFHLEIGDAMSFVPETLYLGVLLGIGQRDTQSTTLWSIKTSGSNGHTPHHIVLCNPFHQRRIAIDDIRMRLALVACPSHVLEEGRFESQVAYFVPSGIEVEKSVEADGFFRAKERTDRSVRLQATTRADADNLQRTHFLFLLTSVEIYIHQHVQLVHHDVDIVASDACRKYGDTLSLIASRNGLEFTVAGFALTGVEDRGYRFHSSGVAYQYHFICHLFGFQMKVESGTVLVDNQFGGGEVFLFHFFT